MLGARVVHFAPVEEGKNLGVAHRACRNAEKGAAGKAAHQFQPDHIRVESLHNVQVNDAQRDFAQPSDNTFRFYVPFYVPFYVRSRTARW